MSSKRPTLLSFNGGYVDTAGYLALQGLFTAHVTGNFVTLGAAMVHGSSSGIAKLLALPVFCLMVCLVRVSGVSWADGHPKILKALLAIKVIVLSAGCCLAISWGPFANADSAKTVTVGLLLVAAMAIQNALHRIHLGKAPPTTLMTGSTTQIMIDLVDLVRSADHRRPAGARIKKMLAAVCGFALGCASAALLYEQVSVWCFALPPFVALGTLLLPLPSDLPQGEQAPPHMAVERAAAAVS